ncbi:MAG: hypothetical protein ACW964_02695 [Candidatus Hodarchaeales archaeon]|jgi:hypothetical protein
MQITKSKRFILPILLTSVMILLIFVNVIQPGINSANINDQVTVESFQIVLGSLYPGSSFDSTEYFVLHIPNNEQGGFRISSLRLVTSLTETTDYENYLGDIYANLYLNITLDEKTYTHEVVTTGNVNSEGENGWKYEKNENTPRSTLIYSKNWDELFLSSGNYNIEIKTFGVTSSPETCKFGRYFCDELVLSFDLEFSLI